MDRTGVNDCLIVDDEPRLRTLLARLLKGEGFVCREAASGAEAIAAMEQDPAPLVISDVRMPVMDGVTLLREIVRRWPGTAVIVVTANADVEGAVACLQLGALDYIAKPFQRIALARALLRDGAIWLLDEPTTGLDHAAAEALTDRLLELTRGRTVLWVTHDPALLARMDWVLELHDGRVASSGPASTHAGTSAFPAPDRA